MGFPGGYSGKEPTCQYKRPKRWVQSLGQEDLPEEGMATHSSILAWKIPWREEPGGLQSIGLHRARHNWSNLACTLWLKYRRHHAFIFTIIAFTSNTLWFLHAARLYPLVLLFSLPAWLTLTFISLLMNSDNWYAAKSLQSCLTLCDPIDGSPPGSPIPGILQARTLEWVAIAFSNAWKWKVKVKSLSRVRLLATPWTAAYQAPLPMGFSRQEYWSGVPLPSPW